MDLRRIPYRNGRISQHPWHYIRTLYSAQYKLKKSTYQLKSHLQLLAKRPKGITLHYRKTTTQLENSILAKPKTT